MKSLASAAVCVLLLSGSVFADGPLDGLWNGTVGDGDTAQPISMAMKSDDGVAVSGSITGVGSELSIQEGSLAGNILQFKSVQFQNDGSQSPMHCTGTLTVDTLAVSCTADADSTAVSSFTVTRQAQ
jgi:hypothetical protein